MADLAEKNEKLQARVKQLEKELKESRKNGGNTQADRESKHLASDHDYICELKMKIESLNEKLDENEKWKQNSLQEVEILKLEQSRADTKLLGEMRALHKLKNDHKRIQKCLKVMTTRGFVRNVVNRRMIITAHKTLSSIIIDTIKNSKGKTVVLMDGPSLRSKEDLEEALKKTSNVSKTLVANRVSVRDCLHSMTEHIAILGKIVLDCSTQIEHWKNTADSHFSRTIVLSNAETLAKQKLREATAKLETAIEKLQKSEDTAAANEAKIAEERAARLENEKKKKVLDARKDLSEAKDVAILAERARTLRDKVRELEGRCTTLEIKRERLQAQQDLPAGVPGALTDRGRRKRFVDEGNYLNAWALRSASPLAGGGRPPLFGRRKKMAQTMAARHASEMEGRSVYNKRISPGRRIVRRSMPDQMPSQPQEQPQERPPSRGERPQSRGEQERPLSQGRPQSRAEAIGVVEATA